MQTKNSTDLSSVPGTGSKSVEFFVCTSIVEPRQRREKLRFSPKRCNFWDPESVVPVEYTQTTAVRAAGAGALTSESLRHLLRLRITTREPRGSTTSARSALGPRTRTRPQRSRKVGWGRASPGGLFSLGDGARFSGNGVFFPLIFPEKPFAGEGLFSLNFSGNSEQGQAGAR